MTFTDRLAGKEEVPWGKSVVDSRAVGDHGDEREEEERIEGEGGGDG